MEIYVTEEEIISSYNKIIEKKSYQSHLGFFKKHLPNINLSKYTSLCSIGSDGLTTATLEKKNKSILFRELYRLLNQNEELDINCPRLNPQKYKIIEKGEANKKRIICIPSLRDQIVLKILFDKISTSAIIERGYFKKNSVKSLIIQINNELKSNYNRIIRTDIKEFFNSINTDILKQQLINVENNIDKKTINLLLKFINNQKSKHLYNGIPTGISISSILSEFYIKSINSHFKNENLKLFRYADDILLIIKSETIDPKDVLNSLDLKLESLHLERSKEKTQIINNTDSFDYIGVTFNKNGVSIDNNKVDKWKEKINHCIKKEFENQEIINLLDSNYIKPKNQNIINKTKKENILFNHLELIKKLNNA